MAAERLFMRKTKEILLLYFGLRLTKRQVARSRNISHSTVADYVRRAEAAGRFKFDQVPSTQACVVIAPCHNCHTQFEQLCEKYQGSYET